MEINGPGNTSPAQALVPATMKNVFIPIFLAALCLLMIVHSANPYYEILEPLVIPLFVTALIFYAGGKYRASYVFIALSIALLMGFQFQKHKHEYIQEIETGIPRDHYVTITGRLLDFPGVRDDHTMLEIAVHTIETGNRSIPRRFNARVHVKGILDDLCRGDELRIDTTLHPLRFNETFEKNPTRNYYLYRNLHYRGYSKSRLLLSREKRGPFYWRVIGAWRQSIARLLNRRYSTQSGGMKPEGVFLNAVLLGDRGRMENLQKEKLLSAGIFHLFSISGAHIGIIALFSLLFLKWCKVSYRARNIITAILLFVFLALSGFKVSAQRAVIMAALIFWARIVYDDYDIFNIISAAGLVILIMNPAEFLDAGFVLSFTLTAAIIMGRRLFSDRFKKIPRYPVELVSANLSASLAAFPLSLYYFQRYSFAGILAGLFLLPLTAVILGISILLIPLAPVSHSLSEGVVFVIDPLLRLFFLLVEVFHKLLAFDIHRPAPPFFLVVAALILFGFATSGKQLGKVRLCSVIPLLGIFLFLIVGTGYYKPGQLEVYYLDVGQGDSACVVFPEGDAMLVDGGGAINGNFEVGKALVLPFLLQKQIRVKWIVVSHFHPDHANGITEIIDLINPQELWISSKASEDNCYRALIHRCPPSCDIRYVVAGDSEKVDNCRIGVLYPPRVIETFFSKNNHSTVIKIENPNHTFLFTGDIEGEVEERLVQSQCRDIKAHVLKIPHHGSRSSSSIDFLRCVKPEVAILSTAAGNRFGFPHRDVIAHHKELSIPILSTATRGGIRVVSCGADLVVETTR